MDDPEVRVQETPIVLKDPAMAAVLAWFVPGLGHLYQGRTAKGILFLVCILGSFLYGVYLGGDSEFGWGRVVYMSFHPEDLRLHFLCQVGAGLPALPAVIQGARVRSGREPLWGGLMAPPRRPSDRNSKQPTLDELHKKLPYYFELGTLYTMIAGLLNILAIYDAWAGPVLGEWGPKDTPTGSKKDSASTASESQTSDSDCPVESSNKT